MVILYGIVLIHSYLQSIQVVLLSVHLVMKFETEH